MVSVYDRGTVSVNGTAIYYDQNGENYKELPFDMEVEVPGTIEGERDEDGNYSSWFTPSDESDVRDEIMSNIQWSIEENGIIYNLEDIEIDNKIYTSNKKAYKYALDKTEKEIYQAVEGFYHNLNTLQLTNMAA